MSRSTPAAAHRWRLSATLWAHIAVDIECDSAIPVAFGGRQLAQLPRNRYALLRRVLMAIVSLQISGGRPPPAIIMIAHLCIQLVQLFLYTII